MNPLSPRVVANRRPGGLSRLCRSLAPREAREQTQLTVMPFRTLARRHGWSISLVTACALTACGGKATSQKGSGSRGDTGGSVQTGGDSSTGGIVDVTGGQMNTGGTGGSDASGGDDAGGGTAGEPNGSGGSGGTMMELPDREDFPGCHVTDPPYEADCSRLDVLTLSEVEWSEEEGVLGFQAYLAPDDESYFEYLCVGLAPTDPTLDESVLVPTYEVIPFGLNPEGKWVVADAPFLDEEALEGLDVTIWVTFMESECSRVVHRTTL